MILRKLTDRPRHWDRAKKEARVSAFVAPRIPLSASDVLTREGDYVRSWAVQGIHFETADFERIHGCHQALCNFYTGLPAGEFTVYSHRMQMRNTDRLTDPVGPKFATDLSEAYQNNLTKRPLLQKELYMSLVYRPFKNALAKGLAKSTIGVHHIAQRQAEALKVMDEKGTILERSLREYGPRRLCLQQTPKGNLWEPGQFYDLLLNGLRGPKRHVRFPIGPIDTQLPDARLNFGVGVVEIDDRQKKRYAVLLDIKEYPSDVEPGTLGPILYEDIEFIETQSFSSMTRRDALKSLERQRGHLVASEDAAADQIKALDEAIKGVADGQFQVGHYHYTLAVFGDTIEEATTAAARACGAIQEDSPITLVPVDLIPDAAWFAQMPGNMRWRPRKAAITSRAFAAMACNHTFLRGKRDGNPWGEALMPMRTPSGAGFYLNLHASPPDDDSEGKKLPGSTTILAPTGGGKTTLLSTVFAMTRKWAHTPRLVSFSLHRDTEIIIRSLRGRFIQFERGVPTGVNPLQRKVTTDSVSHWIALGTQCLLEDGLPLLPADRARIAGAFQTVSRMPKELRWFSTVRQNLPREGANSLFDRFGRWCRGGELGWVFDMKSDCLTDLDNTMAIGFDYTSFLSNRTIRTPIMMELLNVMEGMLDGRRLIYHVAEAWKALDDPIFNPFIKEKQKTIRKESGLGIFDTQEISDFLANPTGRTMLDQTTTLCMLGNSLAKAHEYIDGLNCTHAEFDHIKTLGQNGSRNMLVKQGNESVIVDFDLSGIGDMMTVLSASTESVELLDVIRGEVGDDPDDWLPILYRRSRELNQKSKRLAA